MKILYGVQGTGNGHITRARAMASAFSKANAQVDYFFSGREASQYFDMAVFNDYQTRQGLTFAIENGHVDKLKTIKNCNLKRFFSDVKNLDLSKYDLVINDFEPVTAWAAKLQSKKCIGISHQASFISKSVPSSGVNPMTRFGLKLFAPASSYIGVHWFPFDHNIIPPFIETADNYQQAKTVSNKVLVYLPFENANEVCQLLINFPECEFYVYHPKVANESFNHHIHLRKPCRIGFINDLTSSSGVIANAGFELSSEALRYGKKLLLKPLSGQFEQASNAETLANLGLANTMSFLNVDAVDDWLSIHDQLAINFPNDPKPLVEWLADGGNNLKQLSDSLWQRVDFKGVY